MKKISVNTAMMICFFWINLPAYLLMFLAIISASDTASLIITLSLSVVTYGLWWYTQMPIWEHWASKHVDDMSFLEKRLSEMRTFKGRRIP